MKSTELKVQVIVFFFLFVCFPQVMEAQEVPIDTTRQDTSITLVTDTTRLIVIPISYVGSIDRNLRTHQVITDTNINFSDYRSLSDLLINMPGVFIRDHGSLGQYNGFTINGIDDHNIAIMNDGILLNEPLTGTFNLHLYPSENIERIEFINGTRAFLYGFNSTGGAINFVSKSRKAVHPYSRIRYSESAYGLSFFDGMFSQDIIRGLNFTTGVQHSTYDGRFPNSDFDDWNLRLKLRYNISNDFNVYFSEIYNKSNLGLNGGVDDTSTIPSLRFEPLQATMKNLDSYEKITRYDLQLGIAARLLSDSSSITMLTFYHSTNLREYRDEENRTNSNGIFVKEDHRSQWFGVKFSQHIDLLTQPFDIFAEIQNRGVIASPSTNQHLETAASISGKTERSFSELLKISAYGRLDKYLKRNPLSFGGDITYTPVDWMEIYTGYSRSYRFPTFQELYWRDTMILSSRNSFPTERHHLVEAGLRFYKQEDLLLDFNFSQRYIWDGIGVIPTQASLLFQSFKYTLIGKNVLRSINVKGEMRLWKIFAEGNIQYLDVVNNNRSVLTVPRWNATGAVYFWSKMFNDNLDLKTGIRGRVFTSNQGADFNPHAIVYVPRTSLDLETVGTSDLIIISKIGDAHIHFVWYNLLSRNYFVTPFYPMPDRVLQFGISWEFND